VSDSGKQLQDAVVAVMPEATRDLIAGIKLDGMFAGGSSKFEVELVDDSVCTFEAKMNDTGGLKLLTPLRWPLDLGGWSVPAGSLAPREGVWWLRRPGGPDLAAKILKHGAEVYFFGTDDCPSLSKLISQGWTLLDRIPEPTS
jgi:hypothetical protein